MLVHTTAQRISLPYKTKAAARSDASLPNPRRNSKGGNTKFLQSLSLSPVGRKRTQRARLHATSEASATEEGQKRSESQDTEAINLLISIGLSRAAAIECFSKASQNAYWSKVDIYQNIELVIGYLRELGISNETILQLIPKQPNVLSYDVENRIKPLIEYLISIGIASEDVPGVIAARPNLLGLDVENNLKRMVDYLVYDGKTKEEVLDFVTKTL
ncbi:hypothetical protein CYMTET_26816 [Cymbomonas tetramitiformis]|uniref:Uncharacterized protein n=1 Tax=Cymbomonas tetramitiformis TaxID=36881 RepID=A0AAE0FRC4_9CHLO|nr:hypothetical protein CYMTET_26816 [Cymbomonas tetramitiformis]